MPGSCSNTRRTNVVFPTPGAPVTRMRVGDTKAILANSPLLPREGLCLPAQARCVCSRAMRGLKGRTAIVTGGGGAIGRAICLRLGEEGCAVGVFDKNAAGAAETAHAIEAAGGRARPVTVDITHHGAV